MITKYGLPQVAAFPCIIACVMAICAVVLHGSVWLIPVEAALAVVLIWLFSFFRDPPRKIIADDSVLYSPCDGTVTSVTQENGSITISVFLSIYNVHLNRSPCKATVMRSTYKKGQFRNANDPESSQINEANDLELTMDTGTRERIVVRQISGVVARHIVCRAKVGDKLGQGEQFGMIKFGSRTELILPQGTDREVCAKPGDKVKAGLTVLVRYKNAEKFES